MNIITYPAKILTKKIPVMKNASSKKFMQDLINLEEEKNALGIAANQVGSKQRLFVMDKNIFVNPKIIEGTGHKILDEKCLSLPNVELSVSRNTSLTLEYFSVVGNGHLERTVKEFKGLEARVIQHEIDHLDGILILDRTNQKYKAKHFRKILKKA